MDIIFPCATIQTSARGTAKSCRLSYSKREIHMAMQVSYGRNRTIGSRVISVCALVLVASCLLKFAHPGAVLTYLSSMGFEDMDVYLIAVVELTTAVMLLIPRTRGL